MGNDLWANFCLDVVTQASVTRFEEILPPWQKFKSLWPFLDGLFSILKNVLPTYAIFNAFGVVSGQILNKKSSHLVTLHPTNEAKKLIDFFVTICDTKFLFLNRTNQYFNFVDILSKEKFETKKQLER